jgi:7-carboxy-7-deazaguanine synthase
LSGCNLRCVYCDTSYAYSGGVELSPDELVKEAKIAGIHLVEVTGGEPLLQPGASSLTEALCDEGFRVLVETNGSEDIDKIDKRAVTILDVKTPGSGMSEMMDLENIGRLKEDDEIKFVITDRNDYQWCKEILKRYQLSGGKVLLSPARNSLSEGELADWIIRDGLNVRLSLQLHTYIFGSKRGV